MPTWNRLVLKESHLRCHYKNGLKCTDCGREFKVGDVFWVHSYRRFRHSGRKGREPAKTSAIRYLCEGCYEGLFVHV